MVDFTFFPKLPIELRLKIWNNALPQSATIKVITDIHKNQLEGRIYITTNTFLGGFQPRGVRSSTLLRVCRESNEVYLKAFPQCIPVEVADIECGYKSQGHIRITSHDTLFIKRFFELSNASLIYERLQTATIDVKLIHLNLDPTLSFHQFKWLLKIFRSLQTFEVATNISFSKQIYGFVCQDSDNRWVELAKRRMSQGILLASEQLLMSDPATYAGSNIPTLSQYHDNRSGYTTGWRFDNSLFFDGRENGAVATWMRT